MNTANPFPYLIISDANWRNYTAWNFAARYNGYHGWQHPLAKREFRGSRPVAELVPRSQWTQRIQAGQGSFLSDLVKQRGIKALDQDGLGYCWVYSSTRVAQLWRLLQGLPWLDLSPESVGGPPTHWRNQGGYASEAFDQLEHYGACQTSFMDRQWSLQPRLWKAGWQQDALQHELPDWYDLETTDQHPIFDEVISLLLSRIPVAAGLSWWGHMIAFLDPILLPAGTAPANTPDGSTVGVLFQNSWGTDWPTPGGNGLACLTESRATPDGAAAPVVTGVPQWGT